MPERGTEQMPEWLVEHFVERAAARHQRAADVYNGLTERERTLFRDAAVMGFVQGLMRDRSEGVPKDAQIVALVVEECLALPDLYRSISGYTEETDDDDA